jgi:hypothetical protein
MTTARPCMTILMGEILRFNAGDIIGQHDAHNYLTLALPTVVLPVIL